MSRKQQRIPVNLSDNISTVELSLIDIENILRAADDIIGIAGRSMLSKILKGSKDKRVLENKLQNCPSYGYFNNKTLADISVIVDWMIYNNYLDIAYSGKLPMIIFTGYGWEMYKPIYAKELIVEMTKRTKINDEFINNMKIVNREVVLLLLDIIAKSKNINAIEFLENWEKVAFKKVAKKIRWTIRELDH